MSYDDRCSYIRENRLCFGCLIRGHQSKDCRRRLTCDHCNKKHPSVLHNPSHQSTSSENVVSNASSCSVEKNRQSCSVVPVLLSHSSAPSHTKLVYALLDSQSDSSFILDRTLDSFNVSSLDVNLSVSTMTGVNQQVPSRKCSGFKVQGYNSSQVIDLPVVFSRPDIPINRNHIPKPDF